MSTTKSSTPSLLSIAMFLSGGAMMLKSQYPTGIETGLHSLENLENATAAAIPEVKKPYVIPNNNNLAEPIYRDDSIYSRESALDVQRRVHFPTEGLDDHENAEFRQVLNEMFERYRPSEHSFFQTLKDIPTSVATNGGMLREMYIRYQSAMHATRVAIYFMPGMDTPQQRQKKVKIILDDDSPDILSHHVQLENLFTDLGATNVPTEYDFGALDDLIDDFITDENTTRFVKFADDNYRSALGGWTIFEALSDDWISALAVGFEPHFDKAFLYGRQYFDEIATGHVEIEHMLQSLALTEDLMFRHPERIETEINAAREMGREIEKLWENLENLMTNPEMIRRYSDPQLAETAIEAEL